VVGDLEEHFITGRVRIVRNGLQKVVGRRERAPGEESSGRFVCLVNWMETHWEGAPCQERWWAGGKRHLAASLSEFAVSYWSGGPVVIYGTGERLLNSLVPSSRSSV
jgi:hypothetical protein